MKIREKNVQRESCIFVALSVSVVVIRKMRFLWIAGKIKIKSLSVRYDIEILVKFSKTQQFCDMWIYI